MTESGLQDSTQVDETDINEMRSPIGWLTDAGIREVIKFYGVNQRNSNDLTKRIIFIDPTFLNMWEVQNFPQPTADAIQLFRPKHRGGVVGCVMPYTFSNRHWVVVYVNFEAGGAVLFNSVRSLFNTVHIRRLMQRFFNDFHFLFPNHPNSQDLQFTVDERCAQQYDGSSCGVYAVRNTLDLLDHRRPIGDQLSYTQILAFRRNGVRILQALVDAAKGK